MRLKISAHVDGGLSGGSRVCRPGSEDPHRREWKFPLTIVCIITMCLGVVHIYPKCLVIRLEMGGHLLGETEQGPLGRERFACQQTMQES